MLQLQVRCMKTSSAAANVAVPAYCCQTSNPKWREETASMFPCISLGNTHDFTIYGRCWHTPFCYRHRAKTAKSATRIYSSVVHWLIAFRYLKGRKTLQLRLKGIRACTTHRRFAVCSWIQHTDNSKDNLYSGVSVSLSTSYLIQGWTHNIRWSSLNWIFVCLFVVSRK